MTDVLLVKNNTGFLKAIKRKSGFKYSFFNDIGFSNLNKKDRSFFDIINSSFERIVYIDFIFVEPDFRLKGEGSSMLSNFLSEQECLSDLVFLVCYKNPLSVNGDIELFYIKNGFSTVMKDNNICFMVNNRCYHAVKSILSACEVCLCD